MENKPSASNAYVEAIKKHLTISQTTLIPDEDLEKPLLSSSSSFASSLQNCKNYESITQTSIERNANEDHDVKHVANIVGDWGKWQLNLFLFCIIGDLITCHNNIGYSFHAYAVDYWCDDVPIDFVVRINYFCINYYSLDLQNKLLSYPLISYYHHKLSLKCNQISSYF